MDLVAARDQAWPYHPLRLQPSSRRAPNPSSACQTGLHSNNPSAGTVNPHSLTNIPVATYNTIPSDNFQAWVGSGVAHQPSVFETGMTIQAPWSTTVGGQVGESQTGQAEDWELQMANLIAGANAEDPQASWDGGMPMWQ
jgi:hypothetical protein